MRSGKGLFLILSTGLAVSARGVQISVPAEQLQGFHLWDAASIEVRREIGLPLWPTTIIPPIESHPYWVFIFDYDFANISSCTSFTFVIQYPRCSRSWYHAADPTPPCVEQLYAEIEPIDWCDCQYQEDPTELYRVFDLRMSAAPGGWTLSWSYVDTPYLECLGMSVVGYEVHASSDPSFLPSSASRLGMTNTPGWFIPASGVDARFFRVVTLLQEEAEE